MREGNKAFADGNDSEPSEIIRRNASLTVPQMK